MMNNTIKNETGTQGGTSLPMFSVFPCGCKNRAGEDVMAKTPCGTMNLTQVYDYIKGREAAFATQEVRRIKEHKEAQLFKLRNFRIATFGGVFSKRNANALATASGYMVIDIDGLKTKAQVDDVRYICITDKRIRPLMVFTSPSGYGVKVVIDIDTARNLSFKDYFRWVAMYMQFEYGIEVDRSGSDICRACYLPHDPDCWIALETPLAR